LPFDVFKGSIFAILSDYNGCRGVLEFLLEFLWIFALGFLVNRDEISAFFGDSHFEILSFFSCAGGFNRAVFESIIYIANLSICEVFSEIIVFHEEDSIVCCTIFTWMSN